MTLAKVRRMAYLRLRQAELIPFARNVFDKMSNDATYTDLESYYTKINETVTAFDAALAAAKEGGILQTAAKNKAKSELITALDKTALMLDLNCDGNPLYIINAGMFTQQKGSRVNEETSIPIPSDIVANTTLQPGKVEIKYQLPKVHNLIGVGVEWSPVNDSNWTNGTYFGRASRKGAIVNLPSMTEVMIRLRTICEQGKNSDWSEATRVKVL